nr:hypothetical protein Iba_chr03aCG4460 [Ipomoea batatas]
MHGKWTSFVKHITCIFIRSAAIIHTPIYMHLPPVAFAAAHLAVGSLLASGRPPPYSSPFLIVSEMVLQAAVNHSNSEHTIDITSSSENSSAILKSDSSSSGVIGCEPSCFVHDGSNTTCDSSCWACANLYSCTPATSPCISTTNNNASSPLSTKLYSLWPLFFTILSSSSNPSIL